MTQSEQLSCGVTGQELVKVLTRAVADYQKEMALPTPEEASEWVLARTNFGGHDGRWSLASVASTLTAPGKCPALAAGSRQWRLSKNYHPSLTDLQEIIWMIKG